LSFSVLVQNHKVLFVTEEEEEVHHDPRPGAVVHPVFRIRIGSRFNQVRGSGSGSRRAKMTHKNGRGRRSTMIPGQVR
jgi:hypothetical protein